MSVKTFLPLFILSFTLSFAQKVEINYLTIDNGLSQNTVNTLLQDHLGYLWIGTEDGLNKFDGYSTTVYKSKKVELKKRNRIIKSLPSDIIHNLFEDSRGMLWISTGGAGLSRFDRLREEFMMFDTVINSGIRERVTTLIPRYEDENGNIWALSQDALYVLKKNSLHFTRIAALPPHKNLNKAGFNGTLVPDGRGNLWLGSLKRGIWKYNIANSSLSKISTGKEDNLYVEVCKFIGDSLILNVEKKYLLLYDIRRNRPGKEIAPLNYISAVELDQDNCIWVGAAYLSLLKITLNSNGGYSVKDYTPGFKTLTHLPNIISLYRGNERALYLGTSGGGLSRLNLNNSGFEVYSHNTAVKNSLLNKSVRSLAKLSNDEILVGGYSGLEKLNLTTGIVNTLFRREDENLPVPYSLYIGKHKKGSLWIGSEGEGLYHYNLTDGKLTNYSFSKEFIQKWITSIEEFNNYLILGTKKGILIFDPLTGKYIRDRKFEIISKCDGMRINQIKKTKNNNYWVATESNVIYIFSASGKFIKSLNIGEYDPEINTDNGIKCIEETEEGEYWIGSNGQGIFHLDPDGNFIKKFSGNDGLPNDHVYAIIEDKNQNLWISTNFGISKFMPAKKLFINYSIPDGLPANEFNTNASLYHSDSTIIFGSVNGLVKISPKEVQENRVNPSVRLTGFYSRNYSMNDDKLERWKEEIVLKPDEKEITISFVALALSNPARIRLVYKLIGFDEEWKLASNERRAVYNNLQDGSYIFKVRALNSEGDMLSNAIALKIKVLPPFYLSWWFIGAVFLFFAVIGPSFYFYRVKGLEKINKIRKAYSQSLIANQESERKRIAYELHDGIAQQLLLLNMKMRRLFKGYDTNNVLPENEVQSAEQMLHDVIADVRRVSQNMHPHQLDRLGLSRSIQSLIDSIQESSGIVLTYTLENVDEHLSKDEQLIFFRIIQESTQNMLKHSNAANCEFNLLFKNDTVIYSLRDDGAGFDTGRITAENKGLGLKGIIERASVMNAKLTIESSPDKGAFLKLEKNITKV